MFGYFCGLNNVFFYVYVCSDVIIVGFIRVEGIVYGYREVRLGSWVFFGGFCV